MFEQAIKDQLQQHYALLSEDITFAFYGSRHPKQGELRELLEDVTSVPFKQIVIAMGEGAKAALTAFEDRIRSN